MLTIGKKIEVLNGWDIFPAELAGVVFTLETGTVERCLDIVGHDVAAVKMLASRGPALCYKTKDGFRTSILQDFFPSGKKSHQQWLWCVAHEVGHMIHNHYWREGSFAGEGGIVSSTPAEIEADEFASTLFGAQTGIDFLEHVPVGFYGVLNKIADRLPESGLREKLDLEGQKLIETISESSGIRERVCALRKLL